ncbi:hypothetical protein [Shewanella septentrionalis]|uniref:Uncharacterized protein n=1 Tax=Shewanella septentrionalis TaxID=2952223 RepID=A0A9X2WZ81_9GAMM|nr:hypothetical protein [Shewanella septentrionalis]MCT7948083.1 hypothetical protein [Shewanella septentrionalis]
MRKIFAFVLVIYLSACSDNSTSLLEHKKPENTVIPPNTLDISIELPDYTITEDIITAPYKRSVEISLPSRTNEETLYALAEKIHSQSSIDVQRTFIGYRIVGDHENQAYWATTHYNPNLEVKILGESLSTYKKIKESKEPEGEMIGSWMVNWGYEYKMTIYKELDQFYIQKIFGDGSSSNEPYEWSETEQGLKLQDQGDKERGEYFLITPEKSLEFWSGNGNFYTAQKL